MKTPRPLMRRHLLCSAAALCISLIGAGSALAQTSDTTVRILVGFPPGGGVDAAARHIADALTQKMGQSFVVDNRSGAGGQIAAVALKQAAPNGQTLLMSNDHTVVIVPQTMKTPGFNPASDFVPVARVTQVAFGLAVHPSTNAQRIADYSQWLRAGSNRGNVGVPAPASIPEFTAVLLGQHMGVSTNAVPYRGGAPMVADLIGGQIPAGITSLSELIPQQKAGKLKVIAVSGTQRSALLPDAPTFAEQGIKGVEQSNFLALYAPAGTPAAVIKRYQDVLHEALAQPALREKFEGLGMQVDFAPGDVVAKQMAQMSDNWGQLIRASGFKPQ
jgi:tripartite-type tricarboxylate transporter receptor subunit TctC